MPSSNFNWGWKGIAVSFANAEGIKGGSSCEAIGGGRAAAEDTALWA